MGTLKAAGIGELLWDVLPDQEKLGGAPVNFAYHFSGLGGEGIAISTIGADARGNKALRELQKHGVQTDGISRTGEYPTGYVNAGIDSDGVASYSFPDDVAWDHLEVNEFALQALSGLNCVCFGTLAQRGAGTRTTIHNFVGSCPAETLKIYDINLRQDFYSKKIIEQSLELCNVIKLNDDELLLLSEMFDLSGKDSDRLSSLLHRFQLELAILTRGKAGSCLLTPGRRSEHPGIRTEVVDTIGAGDSFTAAAAFGMLSGEDLDKINDTANRVAAFVCSRPGAMVPIPDHLTYKFKGALWTP